MPTQRQERVNNLLQREISDIIRREMEDPHLAFLTLTGVQVSADLRHANVFVSVLGEDSEAQQTIRTLGHARGFIRGHLMDRLESEPTCLRWAWRKVGRLAMMAVDDGQ
jgi:ribosome-binding factor A